MLPWRSNREPDYEAACVRCEIHVVIDAATHLILNHLLKWDRRQHGNKGLCLTVDYEPLALVKGDRLEPTLVLMDVGDFCRLSVFPSPVTFWRSSRDSIARHRNPIFDAEIGVTPHRCLTIDILHAWHLGIIKGFCCFVAWFILESGLLAGGGGTSEEQFVVSVQALKQQLLAFYRRRRGTHPEENLTHVCDLTPSMFGESSARTLKLKGAECCFFSLFFARLPGEGEATVASRSSKVPGGSGRYYRLDVCVQACWHEAHSK